MTNRFILIARNQRTADYWISQISAKSTPRGSCHVITYKKAGCSNGTNGQSRV